MILIDDRTGSKELESEISKWRVETCLTHLEFGDFAFEGIGLDGKTVFIGVERKTLGDQIDCIKSGRFTSHQVPGMVQMYDMKYLIVEGHWRASKEGLLEEWRWGEKWTTYSNSGHKWMYKQIDNYLTSVEMAGFTVRRTGTKHETSMVVADLYSWWQKADHASLNSLRAGITNIEVVKPSFMRRVAAELPGVGYKLSARAEMHFDSVFDMINANWQRWAEIDKIGPVKAKKLYAAIREEKKQEGKKRI